ncbi:sensor domain-containing protein [Crocosphaera chwakensis]|nr:EAL domain-containing protein [Crocosphaera chwakensis]
MMNFSRVLIMGATLIILVTSTYFIFDWNRMQKTEQYIRSKTAINFILIGLIFLNILCLLEGVRQIFLFNSNLDTLALTKLLNYNRVYKASIYISSGLVIIGFSQLLKKSLFKLRQIANQLNKLEQSWYQNQLRYQAITETQTELICRFDSDRILTFINDAYCHYFNRTKEELENSSFLETIFNEDQEKVCQVLDSINPHNLIVTHEYRVMNHQEDIRWHQWINRGIFDENGQLTEIQAVGRDITLLKEAEAKLQQLNLDLDNRVKERTKQLEAKIQEKIKIETELKQSKESFQKAIINAPLPIMIHAEDGEILQINDIFTELTGYTHDEIPTIDTWLEKAYGKRQNIIRPVINHLYDLETKIDEGEFVIDTSDEKQKILNFNSAPLEQLSDGRRVVISMAIDVTERKKAEEKLRHNALHDTLTKLPNRLLFIDRLNQSIERIKRHPTYSFAVLFIDLDRFKLINDSLGHIIGDRVLIQIATKLTSCVRSLDTVARIGGDEFIILLNDLESKIKAIHIAERILETLKLPIIIEQRNIVISASIGIAFNSQNNEEADDIIRNADLAMYKAKEQGKARYMIFDSVMYAQAQKRLELETNLRIGLEKQEFIVYYQPIISLVDKKLVGFEALVRWQHPQKGLIPPNEFIPVSEDTKLIIPIGEWVLLESCRQLATWQQKYPECSMLKMSINLSIKQLKNNTFVSKIEKILDQTGLNGNSLKLEITESILMENILELRDILRQIKSLGIELSIDDFGTGYSSLSYLHNLPVDNLKIDRSFVIEMNQSEGNYRIIETIITLAHQLGLSVIAEGIETEQDLQTLRDLQCEFGQGYLFSKPLPSQAIESTNFRYE